MRRHKFTKAERSKGGWITTWLYTFISWGYDWKPEHREVARKVYQQRRNQSPTTS